MLFFFVASPPLPGTTPTLPLPTDFNPLQNGATASGRPPSTPISPQAPTNTLSHSLNGLIPPPPTGYHLPQFPFAHPELMHKNPFLPYDFANIQRNIRLQPNVPIPQTVSPIIDSATQHQHHHHQHHISSAHLSPASSRPSSSSPPSAHSISRKMNSSLDINSCNENSSAPEDSDDEQIDVVRSAFVPILGKKACVSSSSVSPKLEMAADSTVVDVESSRYSPLTLTPPRSVQKCDLKAPSSKKPVHEQAPRIRSPSTSPHHTDIKLKTIPINTQKTVWRPY